MHVRGRKSQCLTQGKLPNFYCNVAGCARSRGAGENVRPFARLDNLKDHQRRLQSSKASATGSKKRKHTGEDYADINAITNFKKSAISDLKNCNV